MGAAACSLRSIEFFEISTFQASLDLLHQNLLLYLLNMLLAENEAGGLEKHSDDLKTCSRCSKPCQPELGMNALFAPCCRVDIKNLVSAQLIAKNLLPFISVAKD